MRRASCWPGSIPEWGTACCRRSGSRPASGDGRAGELPPDAVALTLSAVRGFLERIGSNGAPLRLKMTLYRVSPTSPIAQALTPRRQNGKEVAVLVELRARFDEEANIQLGAGARRGGRSRRLRDRGLQDPLQGLPRRPPGGRRHAPLLPPGDGQLQPPHQRSLRRPRALHRARRDRRGRDGAVQHAHRLHAAARLPPPPRGADGPARRPRRRASAARPTMRARAAPGASSPR